MNILQIASWSDAIELDDVEDKIDRKNFLVSVCEKNKSDDLTLVLALYRRNLNGKLNVASSLYVFC